MSSGSVTVLHSGGVVDVDTGDLVEHAYVCIEVPGNPLADISLTKRVSFVMKGGEVVKRPAGS